MLQLADRVLLVDKTPGSTSFGVVRAVRRLARLERVGHCGSLDPLATGLLVLCTGVATRIASLFVDQPKEYRARVRFGRATDSYDADGRTTREAPVPPLEPAMLHDALRAFEGEIEQTPPMVSAVKVGGERLYRIARRGEEVERAPRLVMVYAIELVDSGAEHVDLRVRCGKGCYVRSIAHELGERLGVPAHLESLRRAAIGPFGVERAVTVETLRRALAGETAGGEAPLARAVLPLHEALGFLPALHVRRAFEESLRHGVQPLPAWLRTAPRQSGKHLLLSDDGQRLLALADVEGTTGVRLALVFPAPIPTTEADPD